MSDVTKPHDKPRPHRRWRRRDKLVLALLISLPLAGFGYYTYNYPYGWSHCCDKQLGMALYSYAESHGGWFPRGEVTPEASLSLLIRSNVYESDINYWANMMTGKTLDIEPIKARLNTGQFLTPETCGWHYVEGLRLGDDSRLAICWDKIGLGHNGERRSHGGHSVIFIDGTCRGVTGAEWDEFLLGQERLRPKR